MKCEKCGATLNHCEIQAKQGTVINCPQCGGETKVKYSLRDSLNDMSLVPFGNLKYASRRLTVVWLVAFFMFFTLLILLLVGELIRELVR